VREAACSWLNFKIPCQLEISVVNGGLWQRGKNLLYGGCITAMAEAWQAK
jgi:hypothetical protein